LADGTEIQISDFNQRVAMGDFRLASDAKRILFYRISRINSLVLIKDLISEN
jgi:hypothetical protein